MTRMNARSGVGIKGQTMKTQRTPTRGPVAILVGSVLVWTALAIWMVLIGALVGVWKTGAKLVSLVSVHRTDKTHRSGKQTEVRGAWIPIKLYRDLSARKHGH